MKEHSPFTTHYSLFTTHYSRLTIHDSLFTTYYSLNILFLSQTTSIMNQNTDKIKIALLAVIAITLIIQTFYQMQDKPASNAMSAESMAPPVNNMVAGEASTNPVDVSAPVAEGPTTKIEFKEKEYDFGKIKQETTNKKIFKFKNTGTEPLTVLNAVGSCGCTIPTFSKEPIAPGKTGEIVVEYKPGSQEGSQSKSITVTANTEPKTTMLMIRAEVFK